jgi:D-alanine-D-alanine ligase
MTTDKVLSKKLLEASGIPTPRSARAAGGALPDLSALRFPVLVKPRLEDGSIGIDQESVFRDEPSLRGALDGFLNRFGDILVEEYIEGREFNISLIGFPKPEVLPPAEIDFSSFPKDLFRIVGYRAQWAPASFEYSHTNRVFPELSGDLVSLLGKTARACFDLFSLRDYGRVDLRLGPDGIPRVLEVNANPCLSPDAGFAAAAAARGTDYRSLVENLLDAVLRRA